MITANIGKILVDTNILAVISQITVKKKETRKIEGGVRMSTWSGSS